MSGNLKNHTEFLDRIGPFVFGAGGIGDALLLMSSFFDDPDKRNYAIVFWANSADAVRALFYMFQSAESKKHIVFSGHQSREQFNSIVNHKNFRGKCHIPDNLDYVNEWTKHPEKYRALIKKPFEHLKTLKFRTDAPKNIGVGVWGSDNDKWKRRRLTQLEFNMLISNLLANTDKNRKILVFGSGEDSKQFSIDFVSNRITDCRGYMFPNTFNMLNSCTHIISTDTWYKTFSGLAEIPTTIIKSEYLVPLTKVFGINIDPSDKIFLDEWGFRFISMQDVGKDEVFKEI